MRFDRMPVPVGVDIASRVIGGDGAYAVPTDFEDRHLIEPFLLVANRYGTDPAQLLVRAPGGPTSAELSRRALAPCTGAGAYRWLVHAQSEPDRDAVLPPLARLSEEVGLRDVEHFGLTHLGANAAVDALSLLGWLLAPGEQALLLLTDQQILAPRQPGSARLPARDSAVVLRVRYGPGELSLIATGGADWPADDFATAASFSERLAIDLEQIRGDGWIDAKDEIIVQNLFAAEDDEPSGPAAGADLGSGDVWHRLDELMRRSAIGVRDRVLLVASAAMRRVSYGLLVFDGAAR